MTNSEILFLIRMEAKKKIEEFKKQVKKYNNYDYPNLSADWIISFIDDNKGVK